MNPQAAGGYFYRGLVHWQNGSLSKSFSDFDQSGRLNPKSAYAALWRELLADVVNNRADWRKLQHSSI
jgi:hypothetical protein